MKVVERKVRAIMLAVASSNAVAIWAICRVARPEAIRTALVGGAASGWIATPVTAIAFIAVAMRRLPLLTNLVLESWLRVAGVSRASATPASALADQTSLTARGGASVPSACWAADEAELRV